MPLIIRPATKTDVRTLYELSHELAVYEKKLAHEIFVTEENIDRWAFGPKRCFEALLAIEDEKPVGMAAYYVAYSGYMGAPILYVEDLFVVPPFRHKGTGTAVLQTLARLAVERDCCRIQGAVFDWNEDAIAFYKSLGMVVRRDLYQVRLEVESVAKLFSLSV